MKNLYSSVIIFFGAGFPGMAKTKKSASLLRFFSFVLVALALLILVACNSYFKVVTLTNPQYEAVYSLSRLDKTFIIHTDANVFIMDSVTMRSDTITGRYSGGYSFLTNRYAFPEANSSNKYWKKKGEAGIINEVHFYLLNQRNPIRPDDPQFKFALKDVRRLDIYNQDMGRTTLSWIGGIIGGIFVGYLGLGIIILIVAALTGGSCPYVYVNNGQGFVFAGEIYSGAIYAPLERDDYLVLPGLVSENGEYLLKMSNELQEVQHTNLTELLVFNHPAGMQVLVDKYGHPQTAVDVKPPLTAATLHGTDVLGFVSCKDSVSYCSAPPTGEIPLTDGIIMTFDVPEGVASGKLFIRARNSIWLDYAFKEFHGMLGGYQDAWTKKQDKADPGKFKQWSLEQRIPLSVYVEKNGEWVFADYFNMAGPMALKEDVLALDLKGMGKGPLKIKLESGFSFWEIDYAVMDYSRNGSFTVIPVSLDEAITEDGEDVSGLLKLDDPGYYVQPEDDNVADLSFPVPPMTDSGRTLILHSKGYYHINRESKGLPQIARLNQARKPGKFLEYSRDLLKTSLEDMYARAGSEKFD